ncbi:glycoside hydrolase family 19 protein [Duganella sp. FT80W]|uniref:Glycoside hydrolase family 19 protein n=1 Tax=Duganella guangzhouensis TaxID=2666084 RepID=A0A6I2KYW6_9BURK|nr:glycoside hydrolase family 19 protein [Duganella guangzhouensis]MRW91178.1 glycoside hydrolase family 19 protein [Duganella guangzhouensis]
MKDITSHELNLLLTGHETAQRAHFWARPLNVAMHAYAIDTATRQAAFLAQLLVESDELRRKEELLNYSPHRLRQLWPHKFPDAASAVRYSHRAQALANHLYGARLGNRGEASGDGWRYRGRGLIQLTGRENYASFSRASGLDALADPDLLLLPEAAARSAAWFWQSRGLNALADQCSGLDAEVTFERICKLVNGGSTGLAQRKARWTRALHVLGLPLPRLEDQS